MGKLASATQQVIRASGPTRLPIFQDKVFSSLAHATSKCCNSQPRLKIPYLPPSAFSPCLLAQRMKGQGGGVPCHAISLTLLVGEACGRSSFTNQTAWLCCMWERNSLPNHVHLWGVAIEQCTVMYSDFLSNFWRLCETSTGLGTADTQAVTSPGTLQVLPFCRAGSKMEGVDYLGSWIS